MEKNHFGLLSLLVTQTAAEIVGGDHSVHEGMSEWTNLVIVEETADAKTPAGWLMAAKYATELNYAGDIYIGIAMEVQVPLDLGL